MVVAGGDERLYPSTGLAPSATSTVVEGAASGNVPETHDPTLNGSVGGYSPSSFDGYYIEPYDKRYRLMPALECCNCHNKFGAELSFIQGNECYMCLECGVQRGLVW